MHSRRQLSTVDTARLSRRLVGGSSKPFLNPTSLSGLAAWYRADLGVTVATGVSAWADQSGNGDANRNIAQATAGKQPTLTASDAAYNNKPTLSFLRASAQGLTAGGLWSIALAQPYTLFACGNTDGVAPQQDFCDGFASGNRCEFGGVGAFESVFAGASTVTAAAAMSAKGVFAALVNGATSNLYASAVTPIATGLNPGSVSVTALNLGYAFDNASDALNGKIAEFIVYNRALKSAEIFAVMSYLGSRYTITIGA